MDLPPLSNDERAGLVESIRQHGVQYPVLLDRHGQVIDGHTRTAVCAELGIEAPTRVLDVNDATADFLRISLNVDRRQLDRNSRAHLHTELRNLTGKTTRQLAELTGWHQTTVARDLRLEADASAVRTSENVKKPRNYKAENDRAKAKRAAQEADAKRQHEQLEAARRVKARNTEHLTNSARNAPAGKLNLPALNQARRLRRDLIAMATLVPADRFVSQLPIEACREFTAELVQWWQDVAKLAGDRLSIEGADLPPLPSNSNG